MFSYVCGKAISRIQASVAVETKLYQRVMSVSKMWFEGSQISWSETMVFTAIHWHSGFIRIQDPLVTIAVGAKS